MIACQKLTWDPSSRRRASIAGDRSTPTPSPILAIRTRRRPAGSVPLKLLGPLKPPLWGVASSSRGVKAAAVPPYENR